MGFGINSNIDALRAYNALATVNASTTKAQLRLATGKRINSVADDTSGYAVGKSLDQKVKLMESAQRNVGSAQDMLSTAESQLTSVKDLITSIKAKIADSSNPATDASKISGDIKALATEIANIFSTTKFNDTKLLTSLSSTQFNFQTGADATDKISLDYFNNASGSLSGAATLSTSAFTVNAIGTAGYTALTQLASAGTTAEAIGSLAAYIATFENTVDESISKIGNYEQRLTIKNDFLTAAIANSSASVSRLFDADVAKEQLNATKGQIMQSVATSMLSQLNAQPQNLLALFR
jgi:flagellin